MASGYCCVLGSQQQFILERNGSEASSVSKAGWPTVRSRLYPSIMWIRRLRALANTIWYPVLPFTLPSLQIQAQALAPPPPQTCSETKPSAEQSTTCNAVQHLTSWSTLCFFSCRMGLGKCTVNRPNSSWYTARSVRKQF